jgi:chromosome segregation protein
MRLEKIKLAGFKSFVDPTVVPIPSNRVGVVGPNGCGKSNVIDAVRWVMGESSAKHLRGESMTDVIFNGSSSRKPVGQASVELVFDNSDGGAGGQYAHYATISVKRTVSRDGDSSYHLNGVRCRRKDITDLFLGTGLGPRSYSIIEQGMISRLIEARPEDLRAFLEEAAGISKYKERRKETETRIRHTRENLDRLSDLMEEVGKQLHHLERQAATAERYRKLKEEERQQQGELLLLRWHLLEQELERRERDIAEQEVRLEQVVARQRRLEAEIEQDRDGYTAAGDRFNEVQGRFYSVGSEISQLEQAIRFAGEQRVRLEEELRRTRQGLEEAQGLHAQDEARLEQLEGRLEQEEPALAEARQTEAEAAERLAAGQAEVQHWQGEWDSLNSRSVEPAQTAQVERTRITHLEQREREIVQRQGRLEGELGQTDDPALAEELERLGEQDEQQQERVLELEGQLQQAQERIREGRGGNEVRGRQLNDLRSRLQAAKGRRASLEALQEAALGKKGGGTAAWLGRHGLAQAARLGELIEVEAGWQRALESVLGFHLQAVCVDGLAGPAQWLADLERGALALFDHSAAPTAAPPAAGAAGTADRLAAKVTAPAGLHALLAGIRVAEGLDQALALRAELHAGESIITRDGLWVGPNWLRLRRGEDAQGGVLERGQELRELTAETSRLEQAVEDAAAALAEGEEALRAAERRREEVQGQLNEANRQLAQLRTALGTKRARAEHLATRREHIRHEMDELRQQREQALEQAEEARERLHAALEAMEQFAEQREVLAERREGLRARQQELQAEQERQRRQAQELALRVEGMRTAREALQRNRERMSGQLAQLSARREELTAQLEAAEEPLEAKREALEQRLEQRLSVEQELAQARQALEETDTRLRDREQRRQQAEQEAQRERAALEQGRMQRHEVLVQAKTLEERFRETGLEREAVAAALPPEASVAAWEQELARIDDRIRRLGPINLAAIDEFREQGERMEYLKSQHADITESLETLEGAIQKIDRETRTRFKETFDKVNDGLKEKFPKLFGGGHAYLELTGNDLLDTGVTIMARPPGKRNASIHLLSGGEKALTAVALVFAIFELNPSPFCMLDEVDAPLDDANVGRFCELVRFMSDRVQFIIITHNKVTMEVAEQLMGVTMHEPGVSRLVSVDVSEALKMAGH